VERELSGERAEWRELSMSAESQTKVRELRESLRPENFDAWVCLGCEFRDMAEVQEWASEGKREDLLSQYAEFQVWLTNNPVNE